MWRSSPLPFHFAFRPPSNGGVISSIPSRPPSNSINQLCLSFRHQTAAVCGVLKIRTLCYSALCIRSGRAPHSHLSPQLGDRDDMSCLDDPHPAFSSPICWAFSVQPRIPAYLRYSCHLRFGAGFVQIKRVVLRACNQGQYKSVRVLPIFCDTLRHIRDKCRQEIIRNRRPYTPPHRAFGPFV